MSEKVRKIEEISERLSPNFPSSEIPLVELLMRVVLYMDDRMDTLEHQVRALKESEEVPSA
jgi:hypothetical protein